MKRVPSGARQRPAGTPRPAARPGRPSPAPATTPAPAGAPTRPGRPSPAPATTPAPAGAPTRPRAGRSGRATAPASLRRVHGVAVNARPLPGRCSFARQRYEAGEAVWGWCQHHAEVTVAGHPACVGCAYIVERNRDMYGGDPIVPPAGAAWRPEGR